MKPTTTARVALLALAVVASAGLSCSSKSSASSDPQASSPYMPGFNPPPTTADETAIASPVIPAIQAGTDVTYCSYLDFSFPVDTDVTDFRAFQSTAGHHIMVAATRHAQPVGTHPCTEDDMVNLGTFIAGGGAEGNSNFKGVAKGLAFRVPAHSQIMVQTHWINVTDKPIDGQGVVYAKAAPASQGVVPVDQVLIDTETFKIPPGQPTKVSTTCVMKDDFNLFMFSGHMHEWGKHITLEKIGADGTATTLYEQDWRPDYMTNPPENAYTKEAPFVIKKGESIRTTCEWENTRGEQTIDFPKEMCFFVGYYFPGNGMKNCSDGKWDY